MLMDDLKQMAHKKGTANPTNKNDTPTRASQILKNFNSNTKQKLKKAYEIDDVEETKQSLPSATKTPFNNQRQDTQGENFSTTDNAPAVDPYPPQTANLSSGKKNDVEQLTPPQVSVNPSSTRNKSSYFNSTKMDGEPLLVEDLVNMSNPPIPSLLISIASSSEKGGGVGA